MIEGSWWNGVAVGIGIGWLNVEMLAIPGWANILVMLAAAMTGALIAKGRTK